MSSPGGEAGAPEISVVIPTYNRAEALRGTLRELFGQTLDPADYEVVVVNNNCRDHTSAVIQEVHEEFPSHTLREVPEAQAGANHARNAGLREARASVVAFTDDDCLVPPTWLEDALGLFRELEPPPWCVGGPYFPALPEELR